MSPKIFIKFKCLSSILLTFVLFTSLKFNKGGFKHILFQGSKMLWPIYLIGSRIISENCLESRFISNS